MNKIDYFELCKNIIEKCESGHLNLYHDISKEALSSYLSSVDWKGLDDISFDREMLKVFALFKDAHTSYFIKHTELSHSVIFNQQNLYVKDNETWKRVVSINGKSVSELAEQIVQMSNFETQPWKDCKIERGFQNGYFYQMLGITCPPLRFEVESQTEIVEVNFLSDEEFEKKQSIKRATRTSYAFNLLDNNILYVRYSACRNDDNLSFEDFVKQIAIEIENRGISKYILDLRGNSGGNSEILNPFQDLVKEKNLDGVLLIDGKVFSSGRFAVARFKRDFNTLLIGEPTGGAAKSYGYTERSEVEDKKFCYSIRLWDFSEIFGYEGSIQPDVLIEKSITHIQNNSDPQLDYAINYLTKGEQL